MSRLFLRRRFLSAIISVAALFLMNGRPASAQQSAFLKNASLQYPVPAFPYYHFRVNLDIPYEGYLDVEVKINNEKLRYFTLKDVSDSVDLSRTLVQYRPSFANTYVVHNKRFQQPYLVGWLNWQPGKTYTISVSVRLKKGLKQADADMLLSGRIQVKSPKTKKTFDPAWKNYKSLTLTETAGIDRKDEPVDVVLAFYADEAKTLQKDLRVMAFDPESNSLAEIPSQVYDIKQDAIEEDKMDSVNSAYARSTWRVPIWTSTTTARVAFQADVPARSSRIYLVFHNNPLATTPVYPSALSMKGPAPGLTFEKESGKVREVPIVIENEKIKVALHPHSGVLDEVTLKSRPDAVLYHKMETNGAIHWAPEAYPPPRPWTHTSDWMQPYFNSWKGPVVATTMARNMLPFIPEVDAAVSYKVYPNLPYILATTSTRVNEPLSVQAIRNGEVVFKRELFTHLAWFDVIENAIKTVELAKMPDLDEILMEENTPWLSFYNPATGIAFGGIQIENVVSGLEHLPRIVNPYFYCIVGPIVYWARAMNLTFASAASQLMVEAPKGTQFWEKWAYVLYEPQQGASPHAALIEWHKKLTNPLRVRITEEVESRVPGIGTEIYIDPSKTGWEGRETKKE